MELGGKRRGVIPGRQGHPSMSEQVLVRPPSARGGVTIGSEERKAIMAANPFKRKYETAIDAKPGARRARPLATTMIS